jgi:hypothetical protein
MLFNRVGAPVVGLPTRQMGETVRRANRTLINAPALDVA